MVNSDNEDKVLESAWYVYIIEANDLSLYTGIATNIRRRFLEHKNSPRGAKYFKGRTPVRVVYAERSEDRSAASKREYAIKSMTARAKRQLIDRIDQRALASLVQDQPPN